MSVRKVRSWLFGKVTVEKNTALYGSQIILAIIVGNRALNVGTDTFEYMRVFEMIERCQCLIGYFEFGFESFSWIISLTNFGVSFYFTCVSLVLFALVNLVVSKVLQMDKGEQGGNCISLKVLIIAAFLVSPFFVSAHINAVRQGLAAFLVFYAFLSVLDNSWRGFFISSFIAISIHSTSIMYLFFFPVLFLPFRFLILLVTLLSVIYAFELSEFVLMSVSDVLGLSLYDDIANYRKDVNYRAGARYDFLFFSWAGVVFALLAGRIVKGNECNKILMALTKVYVLLMIPFLLFGFANFSNRYAYTAWLFLSILIPYTIYNMVFWRKLENVLLPSLVVFAPSVFLLMVLNGIAR